MAWTIEYADTARKALAKIDKAAARRITAFLVDRVVARGEPRGIGAALKGSRLGNYWRYRVGEWRIICDIQDERVVVLILGLGDRKEIYR